MRPAYSSRSVIVNVDELHSIVYEKKSEIRNHEEIIIIDDLNARRGKLLDILEAFDFEKDIDAGEVLLSDTLIDKNDLNFYDLEAVSKNEDQKTNDC